MIVTLINIILIMANNYLSKIETMTSGRTGKLNKIMQVFYHSIMLGPRRVRFWVKNGESGF